MMPIMNPTKYPMTSWTLDDPMSTASDYIENGGQAISIMAAINSTVLELTTTFASALFAPTGGSIMDTVTEINRTADSSMSSANMSTMGSDDAKRDFVFDRTDVRAIYITLYTMVFCCCFFGKTFCIFFATMLY